MTGTPRVRKSFLAVAAIVVTVLAALVARAYWPIDPAILLPSRETTYLDGVTGPGDRSKYLAEVEKATGEGVTPETNALVPLLRAVGPRAIDPSKRAAVLEAAGLAALPETGEYVAAPGDKEERDEAAYREWLARTEKPIATLVEASARTRFHVPLTAGGAAKLMDAPSVAWDGGVDPALAALDRRARGRLESGALDGALDDALAELRLGCLLGQDWGLVSWLTAAFARERAAKTLAAIAVSRDVQAPLARRALSALQALPRTRPHVEVYGFARLSALDFAMTLFIEGPAAVLPAKIAAYVASSSLDPNVVLRRVNAGFDQQESVLRSGRPLGAIAASLEALDVEVPQLAAKEGAWMRDTLATLRLTFIDGARERRRALSEFVGCAMLGMTYPTAANVLTQVASADARTAFARVAFALAAARLERGSLPQSLADLVPAYLDAVPPDPFARDGAPLRYGSTGEGAVISSAGPNGRDDGGPEEGGDDITLRVKRP